MMYFDGSLMMEGVGASIMLISPTGERLKYVLQIYFPSSNNAVEYEALLHDLCIAISLGIRRLVVHEDSELVINQVQKEYSCTSTKMSAYCQEVRKLESTFDGLELTHVLRNDNNEVDELASRPVPLFSSSISRPSAKSQLNQPTSRLKQRSS